MGGKRKEGIEMAKAILLGLVAAAVVLVLFGLTGRNPAVSGNGCREQVLQSVKERETSPDITDAELQELVQGNTTFALELYQKLRGQEGNLFYSPYSISLALAMAYAGARGATERQMGEALHFVLPQERLHPAFNFLDLAITGRSEQEGIKLNVANAFWGQLGHPFLQEYIDLLGENYGAALRLLDFQNTPEACRIHINDWVSDQTEGKIEDLLPPGSIAPLTTLVLTNAIYFKGTWRYQFDPRFTHDGPFKLLDGSEVTVPMMSQEAVFGYTTGDGYQAVELPYMGEELSMVILLPELEKFREFERKLDPEDLETVLTELRPRDVQLTMPKFSFTSGFSLKDMLFALGMPSAFSGEADFSGMNGMRDLWIDNVYHKAFVKVNEEGTEAAAATGVVMVRSAPYEVQVNHPFIFLIRDRETGAILFLGRVVNPAG
jgi:serpin B